MAVVVVLAIIRIGAGIFGFLTQFARAALNVLIFLASVALITIFFILLFRIDPMPYIRHGAYLLSFQQLVSFEDAIPANLQPNLHVAKIEKVDTDSDGFDEWVVFYTYNRTPANTGPIGAMVYDNDRGNPPVIFPYHLLPPGRNYLSQNVNVSIEMRQITPDPNAPVEQDPNEVVVSSWTELSIFGFRNNSEEWDFPRDAPPRYQPIGFFQGSGGVQLNENNNVTVIDKDQYERSQLVVRYIYGLNPATNTYWDQFYEPTELDRQLAAPTFSTIDFLDRTPPENIYGSSYPEQIVLGFYASTCVGDSGSVCSQTTASWDSSRFLTGDALSEFQNGNSGYFGLANFKDTRNLAVTNLRYYPNLETDRDLLPTGGGRDVVTGEAGQLNVVDITFVVNEVPADPHRFAMALVDGQWRIAQRLPYVDLPELTNPAQLSTSSPH